jgi:hypothetical protein
MNRRLMLSGAIALSIAAIGLPAMAALKVGTKASDFTLPGFKAGKAMTYKLADARKKGPVVVYFFPAAFTGGCDLEAHVLGRQRALLGQIPGRRRQGCQDRQGLGQQAPGRHLQPHQLRHCARRRGPVRSQRHEPAPARRTDAGGRAQVEGRPLDHVEIGLNQSNLEERDRF